MNYLEMLNHSYEQTRESLDDLDMGKLEFLGDHIFGFTTYEDQIVSLMTTKAIEVCEAISGRTTFDYISSEDGNLWYLIMVNMPFFRNRLEWGTSIRGAWWDHKAQIIDSCALFENYQQLLKIEIPKDKWPIFISAMAEFAESKTGEPALNSAQEADQ